MDSASVEEKPDFTDIVHSEDESKRQVVEMDYSTCWKEVPLMGTGFTIRRRYKEHPERVNEAIVKNGVGNTLANQALNYKGEPVKGVTQVEYQLQLGEGQYPIKFEIGPELTVDQIIKYLEAYENLTIPIESVGPSLGELASYGAQNLFEAIEIAQEKRLVGTGEWVLPKDFYNSFEKTPSVSEAWPMSTLVSSWDESNLICHPQGNPGRKAVGGCHNDIHANDDLYKSTNVLRLKAIFPQFSNLNNSELLKTIKAKIEGLPGLDDDLKKKINMDLYPETRGEGLHPHAMLYFDNWFDSRFADGVIKSSLVVGEIGSLKGGADIDAPAYVAVERKARSKLFVADDKNEEVLYTPPNLTNMYVVSVPILSKEIMDTEKDMVLNDKYNNKYDGGIKIIFCDDPQRINPNNIKNELDKMYGENSWIMVKTDLKTGNLVRLQPSSKEEWKIKNRTQRPNLPFPVYED